jgi:L-threonylcarbamoyladenylate synthase
MVTVFRIGEGEDGRAISEAANVLRRGGLVVYPTETVYGLGADARSDDAVRRVFQAKGRPPDSPISIAVSSARMLEEFAAMPREAGGILKLLPGPLTLVVWVKGGISGLLTRSGTVGVRIPAHPVALRLIDKAGFPITSTSANISGRQSPSTAEEAIEQVGPHVDVVLDSGRCAHGMPSTVLDLTVRPYRILREGPIKRAQIEEALGLS